METAILCELNGGTKCYRDLQDIITEITPRGLTVQSGQMEAGGLGSGGTPGLEPDAIHLFYKFAGQPRHHFNHRKVRYRKS